MTLRLEDQSGTYYRKKEEVELTPERNVALELNIDFWPLSHLVHQDPELHLMRKFKVQT